MDFRPGRRVQWLVSAAHQRVTGLIPGQGHLPGLQVHSAPPRSERVQEAPSQCVSLISMFLFLYLYPQTLPSVQLSGKQWEKVLCEDEQNKQTNKKMN